MEKGDARFLILPFFWVNREKEIPIVDLTAEDHPVCLKTPPPAVREKDRLEVAVCIPYSEKEGAAVCGKEKKIFKKEDGSVYILEEHASENYFILQHHNGLSIFTIVELWGGISLRFYYSRKSDFSDLPGKISEKYAEKIRELLKEVKIVDEEKIILDVAKQLEALRAFQQKPKP